MKLWLICALALALHGCRNTAPETTPATTSPVETNDASFHEEFLAIAAEYQSYGRVDDEARWAPYLCRGPLPAVPRMSESEQARTHGRKLYSLFAKDRRAYVDPAGAPDPVGQVIVKESWYPERVDSEMVADEGMTRHSPPMKELVIADGQLYRTGARGPLFIMYKLPPETPSTDEGWVYGTVDTDGKVTSAGRVGSCMACHVDAPNDRLFGLPAAN